jgi:uncharacterized protein
MENEGKIRLAENFVREKMSYFDSGHDWWHIERVRKIAHYINKKERIAEGFILEIACLLHDIADSKFANGNIENAYSEISDFLDKSGMHEIRDHIIEIIRNVSFSKINKTGNLNDPVLLVLQDADKLDAIGAIGIARAFNYGGFRNNPIYIPGENSVGNSKSTIGHFYDKLLKLKDLMNTSTGRKIAIERHNILLNYLNQFYSEWKFGTEPL